MKTFTDAQEGNAMDQETGGVNFLNRMIGANCTYFAFWETCKYFCSFRSPVLNKKMIVGQNEKDLHNPVQKFTPPGS